MITNRELDELLDVGECTWLDWKKDFPQGLIGGSSHPEWQEAKGEVLKDIVAVANTSDTHSVGYLVYGVKDTGSMRKIFGISGHPWNDALFQTWAKNTFWPVPKFTYFEIVCNTSKVIGIFEIQRIAEYPHVAIARQGDVICEGQVWYRQGTRNCIAHHNELKIMFIGEQPFRVLHSDDPELLRVKNFYEQRGFHISYANILKKDSLLAQGYSVAYYPETRREIWIGRPGDELIGMLKPK